MPKRKRSLQRKPESITSEEKDQVLCIVVVPNHLPINTIKTYLRLYYKGNVYDLYELPHGLTPGARLRVHVPPKKRGRPRKRPMVKKKDEMQWIECDECGTWRIVPNNIDERNLMKNTEHIKWTCAQSTWRLRFPCQKNRHKGKEATKRIVDVDATYINTYETLSRYELISTVATLDDIDPESIETLSTASLRSRLPTSVSTVRAVPFSESFESACARCAERDYSTDQCRNLYGHFAPPKTKVTNDEMIVESCKRHRVRAAPNPQSDWCLAVEYVSMEETKKLATYKKVMFSFDSLRKTFIVSNASDGMVVERNGNNADDSSIFSAVRIASKCQVRPRTIVRGPRCVRAPASNSYHPNNFVNNSTRDRVADVRNISSNASNDFLSSPRTQRVEIVLCLPKSRNANRRYCGVRSQMRYRTSDEDEDRHGSDTIIAFVRLKRNCVSYGPDISPIGLTRGCDSRKNETSDFGSGRRLDVQLNNVSATRTTNAATV